MLFDKKIHNASSLHSFGILHVNAFRHGEERSVLSFMKPKTMLRIQINQWKPRVKRLLWWSSLVNTLPSTRCPCRLNSQHPLQKDKRQNIHEWHHDDERTDRGSTCEWTITMHIRGPLRVRFTHDYRHLRASHRVRRRGSKQDLDNLSHCWQED